MAYLTLSLSVSAFAREWPPKDWRYSLGYVSVISSPNGQNAIQRIDLSTPSVRRFQLFLLRKGQKKVPLKFDYRTSADVLWSPDSTAFLVNDWLVGDVKAFLFKMSDLANPIDVCEQIRSKVKDKVVQKALDPSKERSIIGKTWKNSNVVQIASYADSKDMKTHYELMFFWDVRQDSFRCVKKKVGGPG